MPHRRPCQRRLPPGAARPARSLATHGPATGQSRSRGSARRHRGRRKHAGQRLSSCYGGGMDGSNLAHGWMQARVRRHAAAAGGILDDHPSLRCAVARADASYRRGQPVRDGRSVSSTTLASATRVASTLSRCGAAAHGGVSKQHEVRSCPSHLWTGSLPIGVSRLGRPGCRSHRRRR